MGELHKIERQLRKQMGMLNALADRIAKIRPIIAAERINAEKKIKELNENPKPNLESLNRRMTAIEERLAW